MLKCQIFYDKISKYITPAFTHLHMQRRGREINNTRFTLVKFFEEREVRRGKVVRVVARI